MPNYPQHLRDVSYKGPARYFLTFCTYGRRPLFVTRWRVETVESQFLRTSRLEGIALVAYCFMPDHVHLLAEAQQEHSDLKRFIKSAKQHSGYRFHQTFGERLWQRFGYEHILRSDESTARVASYIVANPVRAGLTVAPLDYPYWGSSICSREELIEYVRRAT